MSSVGDCQFFYSCSFSVLSVNFTEAELHWNGGGCELCLCSSVVWGGIHIVLINTSVWCCSPAADSPAARCRKRGLVLGCKLMQRRTERGILSGTVFPHHLDVSLCSWLTEPPLRLLHSVEDHKPKGTWHGEISFPGLGHSAAFVLAGCCKPAVMESS